MLISREMAVAVFIFLSSQIVVKIFSSITRRPQSGDQMLVITHALQHSLLQYRENITDKTITRFTKAVTTYQEEEHVVTANRHSRSPINASHYSLVKCQQFSNYKNFRDGQRKI